MNFFRCPSNLSLVLKLDFSIPILYGPRDSITSKMISYQFLTLMMKKISIIEGLHYISRFRLFIPQFKNMHQSDHFMQATQPTPQLNRTFHVYAQFGLVLVRGRVGSIFASIFGHIKILQ